MQTVLSCRNTNALRKDIKKAPANRLLQSLRFQQSEANATDLGNSITVAILLKVNNSEQVANGHTSSHTSPADLCSHSRSARVCTQKHAPHPAVLRLPSAAAASTCIFAFICPEGRNSLTSWVHSLLQARRKPHSPARCR